ncbi:MAG: 3-isopropylmalate dehydratase small subunit [Chthoniobacterales bacterium]
MALPPITQVSGTAVHVPGDDIDTDRIIPARFMKCVTFDGLGEFAFIDVRKHPELGHDLEHPLNEPRYQGASILLTGSNFGCGSSREHAPQALYRYGFRAVIAESFAEIFFGNSITLGMPCVVMNAGDIESLAKLIEADPAAPITLDLTARKVTCADVDFPIEVPDHAHEALVSGKWDAIAELLEGIPAVKETAGDLAYMK